MFLLLLFFLISVPVFYIYGLVCVIRKFFGQQLSLSDKLLREVTDSLQSTILPASERQKLEAAKKALQTGKSGKVSASMQSEPVESTEPVEQTQPVQFIPVTQRQSQPQVQTDNSTVLLYLGAFLLLVSASIFVGFNYQAFSGLAKTVLIATAAALSYMTGLLLYKKTQRFQSAGITFTSLGLLFIPLVGLAAHAYLFLGTQPRLVWFVTSLVMVGSYILALRILRTTLLHYLSLFTVISLWCSAWSLFSVPLYYFGWLLVLLASIFRWYQDSQRVEKTLASALDSTSQYMVPIALLMSLGITSLYGWWQFSIQAILGASFYVLVGWRQTQSATQQWISYVVTALVTASILAGVRAFLGSFEGQKFGWWVMGLGLLYMGMLELVSWQKLVKQTTLVGQQWLKEIGTSLTIFSIFTVIGGVVWQVSDPLELSRALWCFIAALGWLTLRRKSPLLFVLSLLGLFIQPLVLGSLSNGPEVSVWQSWWYVGLASILLAVHWLFQNSQLKQQKDWIQVAWLAHAGAMLLALVMITVNTEFWHWRLLISLSISILLLISARLTKQSIYIGLSWLVSLLAGYAAHKYSGLAEVWLPVWGIILGLSWYEAGQFVSLERQRWYQTLGLITLYLMAGTELWLSDRNWAALVSLVLAGLLTLKNGAVSKNKGRMYFGGAVLLVALEWYLAEYGQIKEVLVYSWLWAGYCAGLAFLTQRQIAKKPKSLAIEALQSEVDVFTMLALAGLTVPLGWQALSDQWRGLELMGVDLCLIALGMFINKKLVWRWGVTVLILQVLYLLRDFIFGLPTWAVFGGIGLGLVIAAIVLLSRQRRR